MNRLSATLAAAGILIAGLVTWTVAAAPALVYPSISLDPRLASLSPKEQIDTENARLQLQSTTRTTLVQVLAGLAVGSGAVLAWRQFRHAQSESRSERSEKRNDYHLSLLADALKSLDSERMSIRVGGVHSLSQLAELSTTHRPAIAEILSTLIRSESRWPPKPPRPGETEELQGATGKTLRDFAPDVQAALGAISSHTYKWYESSPFRFRHTDLRKANLGAGRFDGTAFTEAHLDGAYMAGGLFVACSFRGAIMTRADLRAARLDRCNLRSADLTEALLENASLQDAVYDSTTRWPKDLDQSLLTGARLVDVDSPPTTTDKASVPAE